MVNTTMRAVIIRVTTLNYTRGGDQLTGVSPSCMTKRQWYKRSCKDGPVAVAGGFCCAIGERGVIEAGLPRRYYGFVQPLDVALQDVCRLFVLVLLCLLFSRFFFGFCFF